MHGMWIRTSPGSVPVCSGRQVWFNELRNSVFQVIGDFENQSRPTLPPEANMYLKLLKLTTLYGLRWYVGNNLSQIPEASRRTEATRLLRYLLSRRDIYVKYGTQLPRTKMLSLLLDFGATPGRGVWENILKFATTVSAARNPLVQKYIDIMILLVLNGADPYAHIPDVPEDALGIVENFLAPHYPHGVG
jgi:hypothetical protein